MTTPSPTSTAAAAGPRLVEGRVELSDGVIEALRMGTAPVYAPGAVLKADPWGEGPQLALYLLYELHYRGFADVDDARCGRSRNSPGGSSRDSPGARLTGGL